MSKNSMDESEDKMEQTVAEVIFEKDEIIARLAKENAGLRARIEEGQRLLGEIQHDLEKLSLRGGIKSLQKRIALLEEEVRNLGGVLPKL